MLHTLLMVLHILVAIALIGLILLQQGRGATAGAAFGSGASSTVFGARGSASFLTRMTAVLAVIFFSNSFLLAYLSGKSIVPQSLMDQPAVVDRPVQPAAMPPETSAVTPPETTAVPAAPPPVTDLPDIPAEK